MFHESAPQSWPSARPAATCRMKVCVYGAGAIGGYLAARLAQAGCDVSVVARGPHLAAMVAHGLTLETGEQRLTVEVAATDDPATFGPQDYVIVTLKGHSIPAVVEPMQPAAGAGYRSGQRRQRDSLVVLSPLGLAIRRTPRRERRSRGRRLAGNRTGARRRLRGVSVVRSSGARRGASPLGRQVRPGRAVGRAQRPHPRARIRALGRGAEGAVAPAAAGTRYGSSCGATSPSIP